jgi:eukaryotic-like serine/threonine-protein kinase
MIGERLGQYTIIQIVGSGSMGTVYKAEDPDGRLVALKLVRSQILYNRNKRERFLQNLLVAAELRHERICPILEIGDDNDDFFVIMPFIDGKTLNHCMGKSSIPWQRAVDIAQDIAGALEVIHRADAVHRGVKPTNIWILENDQQSVLVSDCCIGCFTEINNPAKGRAESMDFAETLIPLGALSYMSPEQVRGDAIDNRTDIFSLGVVLYEMISGRHPFESRSSLSRISAILEAEPVSLTSRQSSIPPQLDSMVRRALAKDSEARHQSIAELMDDLGSLHRRVAADKTRSSMPVGIRKWFFPSFWHFHRE